MTRDEMMRLLTETISTSNAQVWTLSQEQLERFATLVAAAAKGEWVGLTDEEFNDCFVKGDPCENLAEPEAWAVMKEVEAKLKEKNNG
jgi:hypothetical protein